METTFQLITSGLAMLAVIMLIRRNLQQRERARRFRRVFVSTANDLIGKSELPDAHAQLLLTLIGLPLGIVTRFMVLKTVMRALRGPRENATKTSDLDLTKVPPQLLELYVKALFAFLISDSYHCILLGPIFRASNSWLFEAVREVKPDVRSHATIAIVESLTRAEDALIFRRAYVHVDARAA